MSEEAASAVHAQYNTVFSEFKLTFEAADGDLAAEMDHEFIPWAGGVQASAGGDVPRRAGGGWRRLIIDGFCGCVCGNFRRNFRE